MTQNIEVKVPDLGDSKDVPVIELLVKDGDRVEKDQPLLVLESDKATMEVPAPAAGIVRGFKPKTGDRLSHGDAICVLEVATESGKREAGSGKEQPAPKAEKAPAKKAAEAAPQPELFAAPAPSAAPSASIEVKVPDLGDSNDVPVIEVLVKDGDTVEKDQPLLVLESDKATMEVPAPAAGIVRGFKPKTGDKLSQGDAICVLETTGSGKDTAKTIPSPFSGEGQAGGAAANAKASSSAPADTPTPALPPVSMPASNDTGHGRDGGGRTAPASNELAYAGPATRKFARELGVDLAQVKGSGNRGRIVIEDVQAYVKSKLAAGAAAPLPASRIPHSGGQGIPPIPAVDFSQFGAIEAKPLARIRKLSAAHLHRAWVNIPHVTQTDEADITDVEAFRKSSAEDTGVKLTMLPFIMKAVAKSLEAYPEFNSSLAPDGESLILKKYVNIGFAADTENGLVVPVIRDVNKKGVVELARECSELAKKARDGKLKAEDMKGGCFSISSLGGIGGSHFTPIVNAPEVGILGASRAQIKPVWDGKAFQPRLMLPLSLSYDHRVIDGAYAARFIVHLVKLLSDVRRLAL